MMPTVLISAILLTNIEQQSPPECADLKVGPTVSLPKRIAMQAAHAPVFAGRLQDSLWARSQQKHAQQCL